MVQEFDLYVCASYHAQKGLDCNISSIEETAHIWVQKKRDDGCVAMVRGLRMGDYGFPGQMQAGMVTKEDINRRPIIIGATLSAEQLEALRKALEEYEPNPEDFSVGVFGSRESYQVADLKGRLEDCEDHENNCEGRRVTLEAAFDDVYRIIRFSKGMMSQKLVDILGICKRVIDPAVREDLDNENNG